MSNRTIKCKQCFEHTNNKSFCSRACYSSYQKTHIMPGRFQIGHEGYRDERNGMFKKDANYFSVHDWVRVRLGKPAKCENCETTNSSKYEWANISGEYKRDLSDWARLCVSCHRLIDGHAYKMWQTRRTQNA